MEFIIGAVGAIVVIGLFAAGVAIGWNAHKKYARQQTAEKLSDEQKQKYKEQEDAQNFMQGYSIEHAYGMYDGPNILEGRDS